MSSILSLPVTESELLAYVDGCLPLDRRAEVEDHLRATPKDGIRVACDLAIQHGLRLLYGRPEPPLDPDDYSFLA